MPDLSYVSAHPRGDLVAVASREGWLTVWSPSTDRVIAIHKLPDAINKAAWLADGSCLIATSGDSLHVWSSDGATRVAEVNTGHQVVRTFAVHPHHPALATVGGDAVVRLWSADGWTSRELLQQEGEGSGGGTAIAVSERAIVTGYRSGWFAACTPDGEFLAAGQLFGSAVAALAVFPDQTTFIAGGNSGGTKLVIGADDPWVGGAGWQHPPRPISTNTIEVAADGQWLAAHSDGTAELHRSIDERLGQSFGSAFHARRREWSPNDIVSSACFLPGTPLIATSHFGGYLLLWHRDAQRSQRIAFGQGRPTWLGVTTSGAAWRTLTAAP